MPKAIIFDFDGTIADTVPILIEILEDLSEKYGYKKLNNQEIMSMRDHSIQEIFKLMEVPILKLPFIAKDVKNELNKRVAQLKPIKGIDVLIRKLKQKKYMLAIITSNSEKTVKTFLTQKNLDHFDCIYSGTTLFGKARIINGFLKKYNLAKKDTIYIGDEVRDIEATQKVGIPIIATTWGMNSPKGLKRYNPDFLIDKPAEILSILEKN